MNNRDKILAVLEVLDEITTRARACGRGTGLQVTQVAVPIPSDDAEDGERTFYSVDFGELYDWLGTVEIKETAASSRKEQERAEVEEYERQEEIERRRSIAEDQRVDEYIDRRRGVL